MDNQPDPLAVDRLTVTNQPSLRGVFAWDVHRVTPGRGEVIDNGVKQAQLDRSDWLVSQSRRNDSSRTDSTEAMPTAIAVLPS